MHHVKRLFSGVIFLITAAAALVQCAPAFADDTFSGPGTSGTTLSYFVSSAAGNGTPRVQYLNGTSDKSTSKFTFWTPSAVFTITTGTNASQATIFCDGTSVTNSDVLVVRHVASDTYERLIFTSSTASTITFTANLAAATAAGDQVYKMANKGTIPVGATTKEINANNGGIFNGLSTKPVLIDLDGTSAVTINVASGKYEKP
jgi:hypothetical protein